MPPWLDADDPMWDGLWDHIIRTRMRGPVVPRSRVISRDDLPPEPRPIDELAAQAEAMLRETAEDT